MRQNFLLQIFCSFWLLSGLTKSSTKLLETVCWSYILYSSCVYDIMKFFCLFLVRLMFWKYKKFRNVRAWVPNFFGIFPEFSTNHNFWSELASLEHLAPTPLLEMNERRTNAGFHYNMTGAGNNYTNIVWSYVRKFVKLRKFLPEPNHFDKNGKLRQSRSDWLHQITPVKKRV